MSSGPLSPSWLFEELTQRLASALEGMTMESVAIDCQACTAAPPGGLIWRQLFAGIPGVLWLAAPEADVTAVGGHILSAAGLSASEIESDPATVKSTYLEILGQAAGGLAQAITGKLGHEVTPQGGSEAAAVSGAIRWSRAELHLRQGAAAIYVGLDDILLNPPAPAAPAAESASLPAPSPSPTPPPAASKTFDLLLDVELPVSISFGRAQIPLKDVLKLTTGSIVELNRSISEPAEIIVNNCVIARGEVVVVEGNFGVRIQQVISRQERLRTLH